MAKKWYIEDNSDAGVCFCEEPAPVGMIEITDENYLKFLYVRQYEEREKDGHDFYGGYRADLYMKILSEEITPTDAFLVEQHIKDLKDELITGNWLTAQNVSLGLPLSGIYDQTLKDDIQAGIDNYITNNY